MSEHNLTDEDLEAIERIVEDGLDRQHGQDILGMVNHANERRQPDPFLGLLDKAYRAKMGEAKKDN